MDFLKKNSRPGIKLKKPPKNWSQSHYKKKPPAELSESNCIICKKKKKILAPYTPEKNFLAPVCCEKNIPVQTKEKSPPRLFNGRSLTICAFCQVYQLGIRGGDLCDKLWMLIAKRTHSLRRRNDIDPGLELRNIPPSLHDATSRTGADPEVGAQGAYTPPPPSGAEMCVCACARACGWKCIIGHMLSHRSSTDI